MNQFRHGILLFLLLAIISSAHGADVVRQRNQGDRRRCHGHDDPDNASGTRRRGRRGEARGNPRKDGQTADPGDRAAMQRARAGQRLRQSLPPSPQRHQARSRDGRCQQRRSPYHREFVMPAKSRRTTRATARTQKPRARPARPRTRHHRWHALGPEGSLMIFFMDLNITHNRTATACRRPSCCSGTTDHKCI